MGRIEYILGKYLEEHGRNKTNYYVQYRRIETSLWVDDDILPRASLLILNFVYLTPVPVLFYEA